MKLLVFSSLNPKTITGEKVRAPNCNKAGLTQNGDDQLEIQETFSILSKANYEPFKQSKKHLRTFSTKLQLLLHRLFSF